MTMSAELLAEWTALTAEHVELQAVQRSLEERPHDRAGHKRHLQRLNDHTKRLREFSVRLHREHERK